MKRRTIGPAYERAPVERVSDWAHRNLMLLTSAAAIIALFWLITNLVVDHLLNFLYANGKENALLPYDAYSMPIVIFKIVGAIAILAILIKTRAK